MAKLSNPANPVAEYTADAEVVSKSGDNSTPVEADTGPSNPANGITGIKGGTYSTLNNPGKAGD
jgi:hypothetical protein